MTVTNIDPVCPACHGAGRTTYVWTSTTSTSTAFLSPRHFYAICQRCGGTGTAPIRKARRTGRDDGEG